MGRITYIPEAEAIWLEYFFGQATQVGHGLGGFQGSPYQRGHGLGSFFARLFRSILPVAKRVGKATLKTVGKEAMAMGANVAGDVARGRNFGESIEEHGRKTACRLLDKASSSLKEAQSGGNIGQRSVVSTTSSVGKKKKRKNTRKTTPKSKKRRTDYWG